MTKKRDCEIDAMANRLYKECYIGHIPWSHWRKLAEFVLNYGEREQEAGWKEGHHDGVEWGADRHWS
jgi:hypothetical protein